MREDLSVDIISVFFDYALAKSLVRFGNFSLCRALLFFVLARVAGQEEGKRAEGNEFYIVVTKRDYTFARQLRTLDANDLLAGRFPFPLLCPSFSLARLLSFVFLSFLAIVRACTRALARYILARETSSRAVIFGAIAAERDLDLRHTHAHTQ